MPNQKGSLKDRFRSWMFFLRYKLKLKKQQKEQKKKIQAQKKQIQIQASGKYYSKPKVFALTFLGLLLGLFEPKEKNKINLLEKKILTVEKKLENNILDISIKNEILDIEQEFNIIKKNTKYGNKNFFKYEEKLIEIKNKVNDKKYYTNNNNSENNQKKSPINSSNIKIESLNNLCDNYDDKKDYFSKSTVNNKSNVISENNIKNKGMYVPILEIKVFNKDLKKYNQNLNKINTKITQTKDYDALYEYEFLIKQLRLRLNELLNKYENLKQIPGFKEIEDMVIVKDFDEFNLRKDNKKIKDSIHLCEDSLISIEKKKQELLAKKDTKAETKNLQNKPEQKTEEKKEVKTDAKDKNKLTELILADKIITDNIIREKRKIARFNRMVSTMNIRQKKHNIFYYTKNLISSILNFNLGIFSFSIFKNKFLGGLVGGIMINNSLRSVRKVLKPNIEISYIYTNIEKEIASANNYLSKMIVVCDDSLRQIEDIRNTLYINYGKDIYYNDSLTEYLNDLSKIENKIKNEQETIYSMNEDLRVIKTKNKQKVKQLSYINK